MRTFLSVLATSLLAAILMTVGVTGASAHDELLSSSPGDGEQLAAAPPEIRLEFASEVLAIGALVLVVDEDGRDWAAGTPVLDGVYVVTSLKRGMPVAGYQVRWRVIGEDGHPISGVIPFTVGDAEPMVVAASENAQQPVYEESAEVQATDDGTAPLRIALLGLVGAIVAAGLFLVITSIRQRRVTSAGDESAPH